MLSFSRPLPIGVLLSLVLLTGALAGMAGRLLGPLPLLALAIGLVLAVIIIIRPEAGGLALIFISYTRFSDVLLDQGMPVSIADLLVLWLLVVLALRWFLYREVPSGWSKPALFLGLYGLVGLVSFFYASARAETLAGIVDYAKNALLVLLVVASLQRPGALRRATWTLVAAGLFLGSLSAFQQISGSYEQTFAGFAVAEQQHIVGQTTDYRIGGPIAAPNFFAMILIPLLPLAVDRMLVERQLIVRMVAGASVIIVLFSIIFTYSRGGFLALVVVLGLPLWRLRRRFLLLAAILFLLLLLLFFVPAAYRQRLATIPETLALEEAAEPRETAVRGRLSEWITGWEMFRDHPVGGVGLANYPTHYLEYSSELGLDNRREQRSAHSLYLEIAAETGFFGLVTFGALLFAVAQGLIYSHRELQRAGQDSEAGIVVSLAFGFAGYLVASLFLHAAFPRFFWILVAIAFAAPGIAVNRIATIRNS